MNTIKEQIKQLKKLLKTDDNALIYLNNLLSYLDQKQSPEKLELNFNQSELQKFFLYSDGGCRGNPGPGAYGFLLEDEKCNFIFEGSGYDPMTTNNKMEMTGCLKGLEYLEKKYDFKLLDICIVSDSQYVIKGLEQWIEGWKRRGWKKSDKKPPENLELWKCLDNYKQKISKISYKWVKGHSGHVQNERCDQLANLEMDKHA